jgi:hypothetical protein
LLKDPRLSDEAAEVRMDPRPAGDDDDSPTESPTETVMEDREGELPSVLPLSRVV